MLRDRFLPLAFSIALLTSGGRPAAAQEVAPSDWRWRLDRPARLVGSSEVTDSTWRFEGMPPGWHVTTGPGVVIYHPEERVSGRYTLAAAFALFPNPSDAGYGLVLGADLESAAGGRITVQLRRDGAVRITAGPDGREILAPWTVHSAIQPHPGTGVVTNRLRVRVAPDSLRVFVNDSAVVAAALAGRPTAGHYGLQIGSALNLHVTTLDLTRHLAPARMP